MPKLPLHLTSRRIDGAKRAPVRLRFIGRKIGAAIISMAHLVGLRRRAEDVALLARRHIKEPGSRVEARGHPVCSPQRPRANRSPLRRRRTLVVRNRSTLAILAIALRGSGVWFRREQLAGRAVQK